VSGVPGSSGDCIFIFPDAPIGGLTAGLDWMTHFWQEETEGDLWETFFALFLPVIRSLNILLTTIGFSSKASFGNIRFAPKDFIGNHQICAEG